MPDACYSCPKCGDVSGYQNLDVMSKECLQTK